MAALIAKTLVEEARRTWRAICMSTITRRFNSWSVELERKKIVDEEEKKKKVRVFGTDRISLYRRFLDDFRDHVHVAKGEMNEETLEGIRQSIATKKNKSSAEESDKVAAGFERSMKGPTTTYKAELVSGFERTAVMGGKVELRDLKKGSGHEPIVDAEIIARKIMAELDEFVEEYGEDASLDEVPYNDKKRFLKKHEAKKEVMTNKTLTLEDAELKTKAIKPVSPELMLFLEQQNSTQAEQEQDE